MRSTAKTLFDRDVEEVRYDLVQAKIFTKTASDRSDELLTTDKALLARSRERVASHRKRKHANAPDNSFHRMLEQHLNQANRHVALGEEHLSHQRERIAQLEGRGFDTSQAIKLLELFGEMQGMHLAHRDRLTRQLGILA